MTPLQAATNLPLFYCQYAPQGTPESLGLRYPGLEPTGQLRDGIDFALRQASEPSRFDVLLFTDPQPESEAELDFVRDDVVAQAERVRPPARSTRPRRSAACAPAPRAAACRCFRRESPTPEW